MSQSTVQQVRLTTLVPAENFQIELPEDATPEQVKVVVETTLIAKRAAKDEESIVICNCLPAQSSHIHAITPNPSLSEIKESYFQKELMLFLAAVDYQSRIDQEVQERLRANEVATGRLNEDVGRLNEEVGRLAATSDMRARQLEAAKKELFEKTDELRDSLSSLTRICRRNLVDQTQAKLAFAAGFITAYPDKNREGSIVWRNQIALQRCRSDIERLAYAQSLFSANSPAGSAAAAAHGFLHSDGAMLAVEEKSKMRKEGDNVAHGTLALKDVQNAVEYVDVSDKAGVIALANFLFD